MLKPGTRSLSISSQESYSAIMIADVVADVPIGPEPEQGNAKSTKEETNLAFDGHLDGGAKNLTVDGIDAENSHKTNGGGISRGVILNAVQFGQPDSKTKSDDKAIQLTATLPVPSITQQVSEPKGFKDMSISRKIAFGFSFLPSILFVLCFAIILPCNVPKPCVEELWITTFNHTEAISRLEIPQNVMFTALKGQGSALMELHKDTGRENKNIKLNTNSAYLRCGKIMKADRTDCIVMDEAGKFYSFNDSRSKLIWNPISEDEQPSPPVILFDCNGDKTDEVAIAVSRTKIKIMYGGGTASTLIITECDSIPTKLLSWANNGSSDIVFVCNKGGEDILVKIPQNMWCAHTKNPLEGAVILYSGAIDSLNNAIIHPIDDGLILWSEDEISMIQSDGSHLWSVSNVSHSEENRYILYGNFNEENKQVALLSSSISSGFKVTLLNPSNGSLIKSNSFRDSEATDATTVRGKKRDFILILQNKVKMSTDILTTALTQINDFSTTIVNLISNDDVKDASNQITSEELSFLDLEGNLVTVREMKDMQNAAYKSTMTAVYDEDTDVLRIYLLSTSASNANVKTTKVRNISIANWNKSKKSKCLGKVIQN